ncbi:MAG: phosphoribosylformylglycinamidine synthase I (FGAM synthase I), partial [uncultured bacterium]
ASIANGEGRFVFSTDLLAELERHEQILFKYCTADGLMSNEFPTTPNGAVWGTAGFCNPAGNVVAYMPHPERLEREGESLFSNLRLWLERPPKYKPYELKWKPQQTVVGTYQPVGNCLQFYVSLIITDNAAATIELALQQKGFQVKVARKTHWEVWHNPATNVEQLKQVLVQSGELLNTNKEIYNHTRNGNGETISFLVQDNQDFEGRAVTQKLKHRFGLEEIENIRKGLVWEITIPAKDQAERMAIATKILQTHILFNPYAQECSIIA